MSSRHKAKKSSADNKPEESKIVEVKEELLEKLPEVFPIGYKTQSLEEIENTDGTITKIFTLSEPIVSPGVEVSDRYKTVTHTLTYKNGKPVQCIKADVNKKQYAVVDMSRL